MFIAVTRIKAPQEVLDRMAEGFRRNGPDLKQFPGFLGLELWRSEESLEAVSRWESKQAMEAYSQSQMFHAHHGRGTNAQEQGAAQIAQYTAEIIV
jgi:heme-degrading monooxygenase HmoA